MNAMVKAQVILALGLLGSFKVCHAQLQPLSYRPIAVRYSVTLDRLVTISTAPDLMHIYDPSTTNEITINLPKPPLGLAVSPDGLHAAVTHDGLVSWIDLSAASVIKTLPIPAQPTTVFMSDTYVMYYVPGNGYVGGIGGVNLTTGAIVTYAGLNYYYATNGVFDSSGQFMYLSQDGSSPDVMEKATIVNGVLTPATPSQWPYFGPANCGLYYLAADGTRVYTSCGAVVSVTPNKTTDMYYLQSLPINLTPYGWLSESASLGMLATIEGSYSSPTPASPDTRIQLFHSDFLTPAGSLALLPFTTPNGAYPAHGKAVFFSRDSSHIYVVALADSSSNLSNGWAVEAFNIQNPAPCGVTLASSSVSIASSGGYASVAINATPDCIYTAAANQPWITLASGGFGSGNGTLQWIVRPNTQLQSRSGAITVNGQPLNIQQAGAPPALPNPAPLGFNVVDSDYSVALNRIIAVASSPNELHIYDPAAQTDAVVSLNLAPTCVSVAPDGLHAAVGHDGYVSYVDLQARTLLRVFPVQSPVGAVLLAGNGYIYVPSSLLSGMLSIQIATGAITIANTGGASGSSARLEPNGKYFYTFPGLYKWDITNGPAVFYSSAPFGGNYGNTGWLFQDGSDIIGGSGQVFTSSDVKAQDGLYVGAFPTGIQWAANSSALQSTAVIPYTSPYPYPPTLLFDTQLHFFGETYLGSSGSIPLPQVIVGSNSYLAHGRFAFWNSSATSLYVVQRADSSANLLSTDAVYTISPAFPPSGCAATPVGVFAPLSAAGGFGTMQVAAGAACPWSATSDSSWLSITAGGIGAGSAYISWFTAANTGIASRTANITLGGKSYPIVELGTFPAPSLGTPANGAVGVSTTPTLNWSVVNGTTSYDVYFGTQNPPSFAINTSSTTYNPGSLNLGVTYYWQVVAKSTNGSAPSTVRSFTVAFTGQTTPTASQFVPITPCRIIDTRNTNGALGGPFIAGGATRTIPVQSSACGVPANAVAYSLNVTVVPRAGALGYLTVWPTGQSQPLVSTLNSLDGSVLANAAIVPAGTSGSINAFASNDTDLIVDINGAFVPPGPGTLQFYPLTPCRVLDTRNANGSFGGPALTGGGFRTFSMPSSPCGVPANGAAYSLNVTVVPHGALGYLTAWPAGQSQPTASTLNSLDGTILANAAIVLAGTNGTVSFFASNATDVVIDINGVFAPPGTGGLNFYPVTPCRIADTRNPDGTFGGPIITGGAARTFPLAQASCAVPTTAAAYSLNMTVVPSGALGYLTVWPTGAAQPMVSTLNALKGQVVANAALVPASTSSSVDIFVTNSTHVIIDVNGYFGP